jgi:stage II sporulation protein AA (anti-sigma F factor antagonist)
MSVDQRLRMESRTETDRIVLVLHGELDLAAAPILAEEIERAESQANALVLDLQDLHFIDSAGLRVLLTAHDRARDAGRDFALTPGSPQVQRLLKIAGVSEHLSTVESADAPLGRLDGPSAA